MAAILRSAIGRTRNAVPEKLLTLLRGPRHCPAAAQPAQADLLAKKVADGGKEDKVNELVNSLIQVAMKKYEAPFQDWEGMPFLLATSLASIFVIGCKNGRADAEKAQKIYAGNLKNANESSRV